MNGSRIVSAAFAAVLLAAPLSSAPTAVMAQTSAPAPAGQGPAGQGPAPQAAGPQGSAPAKPAAVAKTALGHPAPGQPVKPAQTPVVSAPAHAHAQKPPAKPGTAAKGAAKPGEAAGPPQPAKAPAPEKPAVDPAKAAAEPPKGSVTGMPLPRWASLKTDEVNLRTGPGTRYPIEWVYRRHDLPVQIEREFEVWRLIEDQDGVKGWVHQATLTGRRSFLVKGGERVLHRSAADDAAPVARLKPGVVGRIRGCDAAAAWCDVQVGEYRGYLRREDVYGIYAGEGVN